MRKTSLLSVLILGAALLWGASANAQCVSFVPSSNVIVANNGFAFQQFGTFGGFVPTNSLFFTPAFGSNVIVANRNVVVAQPRRQQVIVRNGIFGQRVTVINR